MFLMGKSTTNGHFQQLFVCYQRVCFWLTQFKSKLRCFGLSNSLSQQLSDLAKDNSSMISPETSIYPLVIFNITIENHHFSWVNQLFRLGHFQQQTVNVYQRVIPIVYIVIPTFQHLVGDYEKKHPQVTGWLVESFTVEKWKITRQPAIEMVMGQNL